MNDSKASYSAFDTAVYLLTFKSRTSKELTDKLKNKGYSDCEIDKAMNKLLEYNFVNDDSYTLSYIKSNIDKKGKKLILRELSEKGIDKSIIEETMEELSILEIEEEKIDIIFKKRFSDSDLNDIRVRNRVQSYFLRRGFSYEKISKIVKKYREKDEIDNCL
ncbi:MAG: regulatory protein RecX [Lachnospiraceae bacterium]|nr:regulatory protein RecX [Lachnospiraceae bacterium]